MIITNKYQILIPVLVLVLSVSSAAKIGSIVMGPYKVTFDMEEDGLNWTVSTEEKCETIHGSPCAGYHALKKGRSKDLFITITQYNFIKGDRPEDHDLESMKEYIKLILYANHCTDTEVAIRTIDGYQGVVGAGWHTYDDCYIHKALWWMGDTRCEIFSTYPWNNGTSSLLDTIHIEKTKYNPLSEEIDTFARGPS